MSVWIWTCLSV